MASPRFTAVALIVLIAVFTVLYTNPDAWCLQYVLSIPMAVGWYVNYAAGLMNVQFVEKLVSDTVYHIAYYICTDMLVVWVRLFFLIVCPGVYARLPPRANAGVAPNTAPPPALTEQAAVDPIMDANEQAAVDVIEDIEVLPLRSPRGPVVTAQLRFPAVNNLAVRTAAVQPNNTKTASERLAEHREKRRLEGAAHQQR